MVDVAIPEDMWDDDSEGAISSWFYDDGAPVQTGSVIAEIMNEKMSMELHAPASGTLRILVLAEQAVHKGQVVGHILDA